MQFFSNKLLGKHMQASVTGKPHDWCPVKGVAPACGIFSCEPQASMCRSSKPMLNKV